MNATPSVYSGAAGATLALLVVACSGASSQAGGDAGAGAAGHKDTGAPEATQLLDAAASNNEPGPRSPWGAPDDGAVDAAATESSPIEGGDIADSTVSLPANQDAAVEASGPVDAATGSTDGGAAAGRSGGCGKAVAPPGSTVQQTMQVNGTTRYYLLNVPAAYSPATPMPVVFAFHGLNMNNVWVSQGGGWYGSFNLQAASGGHAILVFPQGSGSPPGNSTTLSGSSSWNNNAADMGFFDALVAFVENNYCVDPTRIFATGFSMGAMFTNALGCDRKDVVRAIAPVEGWGPGSPPTSGTPSCASSNGKAAMVIHGTSDGTIPYSIGQASAQFWRGASGCTATTVSSAAYPNCVGYQGCQMGKEVYFCTHSGNHQVPAFAGTNIWNSFNALH